MEWPFDRFFAIDWSARSKPSPAKPTRDALWIAEATTKSSRVTTRYFRTRHEATHYLERKLIRSQKKKERVLLGWDFSFGYPKGLAKALRLKEKPAWWAIWQLIDDLITDGKKNQNNRFAVGAELNRMAKAPGGPFWGTTTGESGIYLGPKKDFTYPVPTKKALLAERRLVEETNPRMQPAWKLAYAGSVGGQSLVGIPRLLSLRDHPDLRDVSRVWPFETIDREDVNIVHAEIYPSMFPLKKKTSIPDREQVKATVRWMREGQVNGELAKAFGVTEHLSGKERKRVSNHEGWVLGYLRAFQ